MNTRERTIAKARELGKEYGRLYTVCPMCSFAAIVDALRSEAGIELVTLEEEEKIFTGFVALQGGTAGTSQGTCGAVIGSSFAVSLATGVGRKEILQNKFAGATPCMNAIDGVTSKFVKEFGSIRCIDICFNRFGKALSFTKPETMREFLKDAETRPSCETDCTIALGAAWATEKILDMKGIK